MKQVSFTQTKGAQFSECRKFRYSLWRIWDNRKGYVNFVCLNPSTADEEKNDPTVIRCVTYARDWGYGGLYMTNIYAYRATDPKELLIHEEVVGLENDSYLELVSLGADLTIAAWGKHGAMRGGNVLKILHNPHYLTMTKDGEPGHPLYLKKNLAPIRWE